MKKTVEQPDGISRLVTFAAPSHPALYVSARVMLRSIDASHPALYDSGRVLLRSIDASHRDASSVST